MKPVRFGTGLIHRKTSSSYNFPKWKPKKLWCKFFYKSMIKMSQLYFQTMESHVRFNLGSMLVSFGQTIKLLISVGDLLEKSHVLKT